MAIHYRPILKAKQGEFGALQTLASDVRNRLTPVIEPLPEHATSAGYESFVRQLIRSWPAGIPIIVDYRLAEDIDSALQPINASADALLKEGLIQVPITRIGASSTFDTNVGRLARYNKHGAAIRLDSNAFADLAALPDRLRAITERLKLTPGELDVIIDLYAFGTAQTGMLTTAAEAALRRLPDVNAWRSITVAGTSFPQDLSALKRDSITKISRAEWAVWQNLRSRDIPRRPDFGDYGIAHPILPDIDPVIMNMSANLRYTISGSWLVFKGKGVKKHKYSQFNGFCRQLIKMNEYSGPDFSWGDAAIAALCKADAKPGNASTWRKIGTSHHLTFVAQGLASQNAA